MKRSPLPEIIQFRKHPELGVDTLFIRKSSRLMTWHHETYSFGSVLREKGEVQYRGKIELWVPGMTAIQEPGEFHRVTRSYGPHTSQVIFVAPAYMERCIRELGLVRPPHIKIYRTDRADTFSGLKHLFTCLRGNESLLEKESVLAAFALQTLSRYAETQVIPPGHRREHAAVRKVKDIISERYADVLSLDQLALSVGLTKFHLIRSFSHYVGIPPHAYQVQVRISRARELLEQGCPPAVAAQATGFADQSHLNRHFKRRIGLTPTAYLEQVGS